MIRRRKKREGYSSQAQFLGFNTQLRPGAGYFDSRQSSLNYMDRLIRLVAADRDIKIQERGRQDTGGREKDRFPAAAVRPGMIRSLVYSEHLMPLVRRERKRKGQFPKFAEAFTPKNAGAFDPSRRKRGTYSVIKPRFRRESIKAAVYHRVIRVNIIHARWRRIASAIARDSKLLRRLAS